MSYLVKPKEIKSSQAALRTDLYLTPRIQSLGFSADLNIVSVYELGNKKPVEQVPDTPSISLTIDMLDYGSINFLNQLTDSFKGNIDNTNTSTGYITDEDLENSYIDFNLLINEDPDENITERNCWFNLCSLDSISGRYSVDGFASESFSLTPISQVWFLNDLKNMISIPMSFDTTTTLSPNLDGYEFNSVVVNTTTSILVCNGIELDDSKYTISSNGNVARVGSFVFSQENRYRLLANISDETDFPSAQSSTSDIGGLKEREIEIVLWDGVTTPEYGFATNEQLLRVQNVEYEITFDREKLKEIYTGIYANSFKDKEISVTINAIASDLQMWAYGTNNSAAWKSGSPINRISVEDFINKKDLKLRIALFRTPGMKEINNLLKSITFEDGFVTALSSNIDVPGRKLASITIKFDKVKFLGTGYAGREEEIPLFELTIDQDEESIFVDVSSTNEYYYEIGWQETGDGDTWSYSEYHLFPASNFTKYIDKYDYFGTGDTCNVRVRAKDMYDSVSEWNIVDIEVT